MIPRGAIVFRYGSITATAMGLWKKIAALPEVKVIEPYQRGLTHQQSLAVRRRGLDADVMIASSNAITLDGRLVNMDGTRNRLAALAFGPEKVILVVGMNKVVPGIRHRQGQTPCCADKCVPCRRRNPLHCHRTVHGLPVA